MGWFKRKDEEVYNNKGSAYYEKGQYDQAILDFNKALEINPRYADAYNNRGIAHYSKKEYDKAWDDVHKAQGLGCQVHPGFLKALKYSFGKTKMILNCKLQIGNFKMESKRL